jgi:drug/metabolite transporter (DMT)-like permease
MERKDSDSNPEDQPRKLSENEEHLIEQANMYDNLGQRNYNNRALIYAILAAFFFGSLAIIVKYMTIFTHLTVFEILYVRGLVMSIAGLAYLNKIDIYIFEVNIEHTGMFLLNSIFGFLGVCGFYYSVKIMDVSAAMAIDGIFPVLVLIGDFMFFKVKLTFFDLTAILGTICGTFCIIMNSNGNNYNWGVVIGICGAFFSALFNLMTKHFSKSIKYMVATMYKQFAFCLFSPLLAIIDFEIRKYPTIYTRLELASFAAIGLLSFFYYYFMHKSLDNYNSIHTALTMRHPLIVIWILVDSIILKSNISSLLWIGVLLIQGSNLAVFALRVIK